MIDEKRIKEILSEGAEIYNAPRSNLEHVGNWANSFSGEDYAVANSFYESMRLRNQKPSTFRWKIDKYLEKEIFIEISNKHPQ